MINEINVYAALVLSAVGAVSTAFGGLLAVLEKDPPMSRIGVMQGMAAGVMLALSFFDLLPEVIEAVGFEEAIIWFVGGIVLFGTIAFFFPDHDDDPSDMHAGHSHGAAATVDTTPVVQKGDKSGVRKRMSSGAIVTGNTTPVTATLQTTNAGEKARRAALMSGLITAVGMTLHNLPEGMAVCLSAMRGFRFGLPVAIAIGLHNIPEGIAVAVPYYTGTRSRTKAFLMAALSGMAEPLGVVIMIFFAPYFATERRIQCMLAAVAGIMVYLSLAELLPLAHRFSKKQHVNIALFAGLIIMIVALILIHALVPGHGHVHHSDGDSIADVASQVAGKIGQAVHDHGPSFGHSHAGHSHAGHGHHHHH